MQSMNEWCGIGRLGRDPELKKTQTGISVCSFSIACDRKKQKDQESVTDWIPCVAWRGTAETMAAYAHKGDQLGIHGHIQCRNYDDKDGKKVYVTEVQCDLVQLLGKSGNGGSSEDAGETYHQNKGTSISKDEISKEMAEETQHDGFSSDDLPF